MTLTIRSRSAGLSGLRKKQNRELANNEAGGSGTLCPANHPSCQIIKMISIVDDDVCSRAGIEGLVRSLGYVAVTFASAEDFLGSNYVNDTSCLITDVHMPGLSGVELHRRLLDDGFAAPTIFVSGLADETTRREALAAGAVGFLSKPFGQKSLIDCLKTALMHQHADIFHY
jgi:FixJ family two-component response regulator